MSINSHKTSKSRKKITGKLNEFLVEMRKRGELMLPSERKLCDILQCCRYTLRHVLEAKEFEDTIIKKGRARSLSMEVATNRKILGKFAFVANGLNIISNPAWHKLWAAVQAMAETEYLSASLILIPSNCNDFDFSKFDVHDILVLTSIDNPKIREFIFSTSQSHLISSEEHYCGIVKNIVAMDNYFAGKLAAEKIAMHGYKRPAFICMDHLHAEDVYVPFMKRTIGFRDGCKEYGLDYDENFRFCLKGNRYQRMEQIMKFVPIIIKHGFDSVFLYTDNNLDILYMTLGKERSIPKDIGIVTINSNDLAVSHNPPVSAVSHGTIPVAKTLIEKIKGIFETGDSNIGKILVKPEFHKGETLK